MRRHPPPTTGPHTGWTPTRNRTAQAHFRAALLNRSGGHCEHPGCPATTNLQAHHDRPGYTPNSGRLLCPQHHHATDPHAR